MQRVKVTRRRRKRGTAVMLDYVDAENNRVQKVFDSADTPEALEVIEEKAKEEALRIELQLLDGVHRPKVGAKPIAGILTEFYKHLENSNRKPSTKRTYAENIKKFRAFLATTNVKRAQDVTPAVIVQFIKWQEGKAPDTILGSLVCLQRIFTRAVERGDMLTNPVKHPDVREARPQSVKHERAFTDADLSKFMAVARTKNRSPQRHDYADFFLLLAETGLRCGEGQMLRWCDVSLGHEEGAFLRVQPHSGWTPKTRSSIRRVPLSPAVDEMLRRRLKARGMVVPSERIFPTNWTNRSINQCFNRVLARAGLEKIDDVHGQKLRVHSLRHTYATRLVRSGADPATVRDLLGQSNITVTNRYFNVPRSELFDVVSKAFLGVHSRHENVTETGENMRKSADAIGNSANPTTVTHLHKTPANIG